MSHISQLHYITGKPDSTALLRQQPEDFRVEEQLSFDLSGEGQHVYLFIEKRNLNTDDVATALARYTEVKNVAVGYAGLKDRNAITTQWFSVDLAGKPEPDWSGFNSEHVRVVDVIRHSRKLKRGAIRNNHFQITLRDFSGDHDDLNSRLEYIQQHGAPNYFGEQRFGRNEGNLAQAEKLVSGEMRHVKRHLRGIYLSAMRSFLFNQVLSQRVADKTWNHPIPGDVFMLDGSHSVFSADAIDEQIIMRVKTFDIHPTGPMWGSGNLMTTHEAFELERRTLEAYQSWCQFLEKAGLKQERRALRIKVEELAWEWQDTNAVLRFNLPTGSYATSILRELVNSNSG